MITAYLSEQLLLHAYQITVNNNQLIQNAVWIDILQPTPEEEKWLEAILKVNIPTREEMGEIELSSRFYKEDAAAFMTATMLINSDSDQPIMDAVTFILTDKQLITVHYFEPQAFTQFKKAALNLGKSEQFPINLLMGLLEAVVDRSADILEKAGKQLDSYSQIIFRQRVPMHTRRNIDLQKLLQDIGANGDISTKTQESLITFNRLLAYFEFIETVKIVDEIKSRLVVLEKDINSLNEHVKFLSDKANFLLNATLGMINIEQNTIIRIFSIAAVIFLPPTLIATVYGMNFKFMPELSWPYAYPVVLCFMGISAWLPYKYFRRRKWL